VRLLADGKEDRRHDLRSGDHHDRQRQNRKKIGHVPLLSLVVRPAGRAILSPGETYHPCGKARCAARRVLDGSLVARIHACHLDRPASVGDLLGHPFFDRGLGSAGEEDVGPFPGERTSHRLADRPTP
jgi:hypothetical protein